MLASIFLLFVIEFRIIRPRDVSKAVLSSDSRTVALGVGKLFHSNQASTTRGKYTYSFPASPVLHVRL